MSETRSFHDGRVVLHAGDCLAVLDTLPENSVDSVCVDPPYHLTTGKKGGTGIASLNINSPAGRSRISTGFMGHVWDGGDIAFRPETWAKVLRVLKPGGHLIAFGGTRTYHRMACAIEDAGLEIREMHAWVFGSGFPKSLDVSKAIDKAAGAEREVIAAVRVKGGGTEHINRSNAATHKYRPDGYQKGENVLDVTAPATEAAKQWEGWGTATKPAMEPVCLARKPLSEKTVAANVLRWGTGALNIDATRVGYENDAPDPATNPLYRALNGYKNTSAPDTNSSSYSFRKDGGPDRNPSVLGRWPANICHDGSEEVLALFPQSKGQQGDVRGTEKSRTGDENTVCYGEYGARIPFAKRNDSGSAARFFYSAKADATDRITRHVEEVTIEWTSEQGQCQARLQVDTGQSPKKAIVASGLGTAQEWNMFLFGSTITDLCQTDSKFIIETKTNSTTELKTWNCLTHLLINAFTAAANSEKENGSSLAKNAERFGLSLTIIPDKTVSLPGASHAVSQTPLKISVSGRQHGHPTIKPINLMRWLVRMVTPPGGTVLDCFAGTGTTGHAALLEGFNAVLIEREAEYQADIERRMELVFAGEIERAAHAEQEPPESLPLFGSNNAGGGKKGKYGTHKCKFFVGPAEPSGQSE